MAGYWPTSFFACLSDRDGVKVHKGVNKRTRTISSILTEQAWPIKDLLYNFSCGTRQVVPSKQDSSIFPARIANHNAGFDSSCPLTELAI